MSVLEKVSNGLELLLSIFATYGTCRNIMWFTILSQRLCNFGSMMQRTCRSLGCWCYPISTCDWQNPFYRKQTNSADCRGLSLDCIDLCQKLLRSKPGQDQTLMVLVSRLQPLLETLSLAAERVTFEEFFNHLFLPERQSYELSRQYPYLMVDRSLGHSDPRFGSGRVIRFSDYSG
ncbi:hypothetical protein YC2023_047344 [Brassica napus]